MTLPLHLRIAHFMVRQFGLLAVAVLLCLPPASAAGKFKTLYFFKGGSDGYAPSGALVFDSSGNLYGTTYSGGTGANCSFNGATCGTVFQLTPKAGGKWKKTTLYNFQSGTDGANPNGGIVFDSFGNLYGTTLVGGEGISYGCGTVFKLTPNSQDWTESVAYTFCSVPGAADGYFPNPGLIQDSAGNFYGTTFSGGLALGGVIVEFTPGNTGLTSQTLYDFCLVDQCSSAGANPADGLVADSSGNFYGTTTQGGNYADSCGGFPGGCGVVFKLKHDSHGNWTQSVLHAFVGPEGTQPGSPLVFDKQGNLYGTTSTDGAFGFGTAFKLTPSARGAWKYHTLYNFRIGARGAGSLNSGLILDASGNLYGSIGAGGLGVCAGSGCGAVYRLSPAKNGRWRFTTLHKFTGGRDGGQPGELITDAHGNLYGNAAAGGAAGVVFEIMP